MQVIIKNSADEIASCVAEIIATKLNEKGDSVIGFATGSSPVKTYQKLIEMYSEKKVSFKDMVTFNLDEYCSLTRDNVNSYYYFMKDNLFGKVDVDFDKVNFLSGTAENADEECKRYENEISKVGGIDIQLLGIGRNGHIGFNEPSDKFSNGAFKVKLTDSTIEANKIYFEEDEMPLYALTMGCDDIMKSKKIVLIATGKDKADAVLKMVEGEVTPQCPASILQNHDDVIVFLDGESASLLK